MSTFSDWIEAVEDHAQGAGAAIDEPMTDICIGLPWPRGRCGRIYWDGEAEAARVAPNGMHYSLNSQLVAARLGVTFYWPIADADEAAAANRILEMADIVHELRTRLLGDDTLGGKATDIDVALATTDFIEFGGALYAVATLQLTIDHLEYTIAE